MAGLEGVPRATRAVRNEHALEAERKAVARYARRLEKLSAVAIGVHRPDEPRIFTGSVTGGTVDPDAPPVPVRPAISSTATLRAAPTWRFSPSRSMNLGYRPGRVISA